MKQMLKTWALVQLDCLPAAVMMIPVTLRRKMTWKAMMILWT